MAVGVYGKYGTWGKYQTSPARHTSDLSMNSRQGISEAPKRHAQLFYAG